MTISDVDFKKLQDDVAQIRKELGTIPNPSRDGYEDDPAHTEIHEIRGLLDANATKVDCLVTRLTLLESETPVPNPSPSVQVPLPGGDFVAPRISAGAPPSEVYGELLQAHGQGDANILLEANLGLSSAYLKGKVAKADITLSGGEGSCKIRQNESNGKSADGIRAMSIAGFDGQGTISGQQRYPNVTDIGGVSHSGEESIKGQDWWLNVDHVNKVIDIVSPQPGYRLRLRQTPAGNAYAEATDIR